MDSKYVAEHLRACAEKLERENWTVEHMANHLYGFFGYNLAKEEY